MTACTTAPSNPEVVVERDVEIDTPDGKMDAHFVAPAAGKWRAVLVWPDIMGLRPAFRLMGQRLAKSDYAVFDRVQADRAWVRLLATFKAGL